MRKLKILSLALIAATSLGVNLQAQAAEKFKVMTTFTVLQDIAKNIAGEYAQVESLTKIGAEIHDYEPTSKDLVRLQKSQLIITNGLNLERWFERFYEKSSKKIPTIVASAGVEPDYILSGPYKGTPNPHGWMSLKNAYIYVNNIEKALIEFDPKHAMQYKANASVYRQKIQKIETDILTFLAKNKLKADYLITSESAFSYLSRDIGLKYASIWPINAEDVGTPKQISDMVKLVKDNQIKVVFSGSTMDLKPMETVMKETGAKFGGYLYVDTLTEKDGPVPTYLDMLQKTTYQIIDGFQAVIKK